MWDSRGMEGEIYEAILYNLPVGFILLENNSQELKTIRGTWVNSDLRGKGVGQFLMKAVCSDYEHRPVDIKVNITKGAEGFYEKFGFKIVGHRDDFDMNIGLWKALEFHKI